MAKEFRTVVSSTTALATEGSVVVFSPESWKRNEYKTPPHTHPIYNLIGQVTAEWSRLEHALDRIIWSLAGISSAEAGCITSQVLGATARYRIILRQLTLRKDDKPNLEKFLPRVEKLMRLSYDPQERRNRIVHDAWYLHSEKDATGQFRSFPNNADFGISAVDFSDLERTISEARSLAEQVETLFAEISSEADHVPVFR